MLQGCAVRRAVTALFVFVLAAGSAEAGAPRTHDGFFLRLSGGGGTAKTELSESGGTIKVDGSTGDVNIAIGGIVAPNLALHGTLLGWVTSDPDVTITGFGSGTAQNTDLDLTAIGAGLTYYFMPVNIYVSGTLGGGSMTLDTPLGSADTDTGLVGEFAVGKEWWVGGNWGLGLSGSIGFHSIPDKGTTENWSGTSLALRFSATLN
jgi:hypothetical protein